MTSSTEYGSARDNIAPDGRTRGAVLCHPMIVFAYGSLMYEPELPDAVLERFPARLSGHHRRFSKRARSRGCPADVAPAVPAVPGFVEHGFRFSLVLGTEPGGQIDGLALRYDPAHADAALARIERREGAAYLRTALPIRAADGRIVEAWVWLSNPDSALLVDLDVAQQAAVLRAATPTRDVDGRARGAGYLRGVARVLDQLGTPDPRIDALIDAVDHA